MTYDQIDKIADLCNPLMALALIILAFAMLKNAAWPFLLRNGLAVVVVQQISKYVQKHGPWGHGFPSTHFAVALTLAIGLAVLKRRLWPVALGFVVVYAILMVPIQHYHSPAEMIGALFSIPIALVFHWKSRSVKRETAPIVNN